MIHLLVIVHADIGRNSSFSSMVLEEKLDGIMSNKLTCKNVTRTPIIAEIS